MIPTDLRQIKILIKKFRKWHLFLKLLEKTFLLSQSTTGILFSIYNFKKIYQILVQYLSLGIHICCQAVHRENIDVLIRI